MSIWRMRIAIILIIIGLLLLLISHLTTPLEPKKHLYQENTLTQASLDQADNYL